MLDVVSNPEAVAARRFAAEAKDSSRFLHDEVGFDGPFVDYPSFAMRVTLKSATTGVKVTFDTKDLSAWSFGPIPAR